MNYILKHLIEYFSTCIFCGEKNDDFIRDGLETHYWSTCPMLRRCQECNQVLLFFSIFFSSTFINMISNR